MKSNITEAINIALKSGRGHNAVMMVVYTIMTFVLAILKLTGYISITWLWVFSPIWLPPAVGITVLFSVLALVFAVGVISVIVGSLIICLQMLWEKLTK